MARMNKQELIEALTALKVEFDENANYNDLYALHKAQPEDEPLAIDSAVVKDIHKRTGFSAPMIKAALKAGFAPEQITAFNSEESLRQGVARVKPSILASAGIPADPKPPKPPVEMVETSTLLTLHLSPMRAKTPLRADDEQRDMDAYINRKAIRRTITRITIDRQYKPGEDNKYLTEITIYYEVPKGE